VPRVKMTPAKRLALVMVQVYLVFLFILLALRFTFFRHI
jgi:hypothetical protein